jgi:hypothetical protein
MVRREFVVGDYSAEKKLADEKSLREISAADFPVGVVAVQFPPDPAVHGAEPRAARQVISHPDATRAQRSEALDAFAWFDRADARKLRADKLIVTKRFAGKS